MLKIRLMRIGAKKKPFYRVVVVDEQAKRTGGYIELLGTYNPLTEPKEIKLKQDRIDHWTKQGAQPSTGYLRMIGKAPQRPPRKPKKEEKSPVDSSSKQAAPVTQAPAVEDQKTPTAEEPKTDSVAPSETTPVEQPAEAPTAKESTPEKP